ncbi:MAG: hypothetical protein O2955_08315 [Planctomycetota bacterium]|nr:hypothetical protein [Planctomycetota bacterium]MDA1212507.1 hypothetical protein [Planctomycetota bacterium]
MKKLLAVAAISCGLLFTGLTDQADAHRRGHFRYRGHYNGRNWNRGYYRYNNRYVRPRGGVYFRFNYSYPGNSNYYYSPGYYGGYWNSRPGYYYSPRYRW